MFARDTRKRSPARSKARKKPAARGKKSSKSSGLGLRNPFPSPLEQRHLDVIGLSLIALGLFLSLVLYLGWEGGSLGGGLVDAMTFTLGKVAWVIPVSLFIAGGVLIARPMMPAVRPLRTGAICLGAGLLLLFAAQTAGIGPERPLRPEFFDPDWVDEHGGMVGEGLYWVTNTLFQRVGSHIIAVLLLLAGGLLITGTSIATAIASSRRAIAQARHVGTGMTQTVYGRRGAGTAPEPVPWADELDEEPLYVDEPVTAGFDETEPDDAEPDEEPATLVEDADEEDFDPETEALDPVPVPAGPIEVVREKAVGETPMGQKRGVTTSEEIDYKPPLPKVLEKGKRDTGPDTRDHEAIGRKLVETLGHFGVEARIVGIVSGPHVSRFELRLAPGTKVKKVTELTNDLAYALASTDIRILAPIPGKQAVGVEVPNTRRKIVRLGDIYADPPRGSAPLMAWLGKGIDGNPVSADLAKMPHILVAGTTGSGKSGCVNAILSSILMHSSPNEVRLVLVDPKQVELNHYDSVPHLLTPVVTSPRLAANVLANLIAEMENRYGMMGQARARNLEELNRMKRKAGEAPLPHILCVIDELADLMMVAPAEVEDSIIRLAQKSRATGIHLVLATQRPSTDIITGTIKVNIPARIAFAVSSQTDSRVILDQGGAEALLGQGDMLFRGAGTSKLARIQGAYVTEEEIARITRHWSRQGEPEFEEELLEAPVEEPSDDVGDDDFDPDQDDLLDEAIRLVVQTETASVSMIQRRLRVGYTRAGRLIDMLERRGVISGYEGSKPRQVLITSADLSRVLSGVEPSSAADDADDAGDTTEHEPVTAPVP